MTQLQSIVKDAADFILSIYKHEPPIDVRELCEDYLGIKYRHKLLPQGTNGFWMRTKKGKPNIVVSDHQTAGQRQWVSLHEIGHEMIARKVEFTDKFHLDHDDSIITPLESACNMFAALVLMPEQLMREWWKELKTNKQFRVQIMADRCNVSLTAMEIRLKSLRLIR